jgi:hypothetical protein
MFFFLVGLDTMIEKTNKGEKNWLHKAITELMDGWMDGMWDMKPYSLLYACPMDMY